MVAISAFGRLGPQGLSLLRQEGPLASAAALIHLLETLDCHSAIDVGCQFSQGSSTPIPLQFGRSCTGDPSSTELPCTCKDL